MGAYGADRCPGVRNPGNAVPNISTFADVDELTDSDFELFVRDVLAAETRSSAGARAAPLPGSEGVATVAGAFRMVREPACSS